MKTMKLSEVIKNLQDCFERHGDLDVQLEGMWTIGHPADTVQLYDTIAWSQRNHDLSHLRNQVEVLKSHLRPYREADGYGLGMSSVMPDGID